MSISELIPAQAVQVAHLPVQRYLPARTRQMVGPFIFLDRAGPVIFPAQPMATGVPEHPHAGLSTFTYLMAGRQHHRDSAGNDAIIEPGDIALMTAGRGITHEELSIPNEPSVIDLAQLWLALPDGVEDIEPGFELHQAQTLPRAIEDGASAVLAMGEGWGLRGPVTQHHPGLFADIQLEANGRISLPEADERALLVLEGDLRVDALPVPDDALVLLDTDAGQLSSDHGARVLLLGGTRFSSRRWIASSFVASSSSKLSRWIKASRTAAWPRILREPVS